MPQCQPTVHEGHEGKSDEACNGDDFVQDYDVHHNDFARGDDFASEKDDTIAMIVFWLAAETVSKDGDKGKIGNRVGKE